MSCFLAAGLAELVDHLVLRGPCQERDKVPAIFEFRRHGADPVEEAPPDALEKVDRVKSRPEHPRQLAADHQADLSLIAREEFASRVLVARMNPGQEPPDVVARHLIPERLTDHHGTVSFPKVLVHLRRTCRVSDTEE